jgi:hypothetical protein
MIKREAIAEINTLASNVGVDITSAEVMNSAFYRAIQTITELAVNQLLKIPQTTLLLIARIVAASPPYILFT